MFALLSSEQFDTQNQKELAMKGVPTSMIPTNHATSGGILPSDELASFLPPGWPLDLPLTRIRTCGPLAIEVLQDLQAGPHERWQAMYGPPAADLLKMKGMTTATVLLALLTTQPGGFASKDFLIQTLAHFRHPPAFEDDEDEEAEPLARLDNVVSLLRKLLYPPRLATFDRANQLRKHLVRFVRATQESGPGYQLAQFPLLWVDVEAMEHYVARARWLEERGEDGLEEWQAAYQIGMRGPFLCHEPYSDWADWRRGRVADLLWQSASAQWKRAASWEQGSNGREAAARLLLEFWQAHMTNEDAFRSLVELLEKQERFQLAEECYTRLCAALDHEGRLPQRRTQETMHFLRTAQLQREDHRQVLIHEAPSPGLVAVETALTRQEVSGTRGPETPAERIAPETRHLIGRETWLAGVCQMIQAFPAKKLILLQGPIGVGKSSELTRLAHSFQSAEHASSRVIWLPFATAEWKSGPEAALEVFIRTILGECGIASFPPEAPRERLAAALLTYLKSTSRPTMILLDNAECVLEENGELALCWETFLTQFVRSRHQATLLLATKEWHGWPGRETIFVAETIVPPFTPDESVHLLRRLGLEAVPTELLQSVGAQMSGIPLLLEWTARLAADPLLLDDWAGFDENEAILQAHTTQASISARLQRILDDPSLLGKHLASQLSPLLERLLEKHLSDEARLVLMRLAVANVPLGKPALQILCPRPRLLKELRDTSLLVAYTNRVQLLPVVAFTVQQQMPAEQRQQAEQIVIQAYTHWLDEGNLEMEEAGYAVAELARLLLMHRRLLDVAQLLLYYGWLSFKLGAAPRIAHLAEQIMQQHDWQSSLESWCGGKLLYYYLIPYLGKQVEISQRTKDYFIIQDAVYTEKLALKPQVEIFLAHYLIMDAMDKLQFEEAQKLLEACERRLEPVQAIQIDVHAALLEKRGMVLSRWCEYAEEQKEKQRARLLREQAIAVYQQAASLFTTCPKQAPLKTIRLKRWQAHALNFLGYHLYRSGQYEEALLALKQSTVLQEQGYGGRAGLPPCYGDTSLILAALGRFREAILFDEKALTEARRVAELGHVISQEDIWIYFINRGCLYLRLGRINEAEQLLREAQPHICAHRRMYLMFAKEALDEIEQWRRSAVSPQHQLDWRWVERYRALTSFDSYWWLASAGPFTDEEKQEWEQLFAHHLDGDAKERLGQLMAQSTRREVQNALVEQREPQFSYPALNIEEVHSRIARFLQLDAEIAQEEPNAIIRRLYHGTIEEDIDYLRLIEATYEGDNDRFWEYNRRTIPTATPEEMQLALVDVKRHVLKGLLYPETQAASERIVQVLRDQCGLDLDLSTTEAEEQELRQSIIPTLDQEQPMLSAQAAKRFFETVLKEVGFDDWQVVIDPTVNAPRIEQGLRCLFLAHRELSLERIKHYLSHELGCHAARCVAGERSLIGLLGIHTKNSLEAEEGIAAYIDIQEEQQQNKGQFDMRIWAGTLATGLASGTLTPPQSFQSLFTFFEALFFLRRRLQKLDADEETAKEKARQAAITRCLRTYRGVPDLKRKGICFTQDAIYLRGFQSVLRAFQEDNHILDRLAVGVVAIEQLADLQELGITSAPQPLRTLAQNPQLDAYILSFEDESGEDKEKAR